MTLPTEPIRVLLVEDDAGHAELLVRSLHEPNRYEVRLTRSLAEARAAIAAAAPDLVLAAWKLVDGPGIGLLPPDGAFPVVILTSNGTEADAVEMMKAGALDYVVKSGQLFASVPDLVDRSLRTWTHVVERRKAERALRESEARTAGIVNTAADAIVTIDEFGTIETVNPATEQMFGYPVDEMIGRNVAMLMPDPDRAGHDGYLARYRATGEARMIGNSREVVARHKDGTTFPVRLSVGEMEIGGRRVFAGFVRDLTAYKRVERQFLQSQKMEAIGQLAGGVAHDFNNLLTVIMGYGSLLQGMVPEWDPKRAMLDEIVTTADRAAGLTRQLLTVSRAPGADPVILDPNKVVTELSRLLRRLIGSTIVLHTELQPAAMHVRIDASHLEQIVMNLALNARDAIAPSSGVIRILTGLVSLSAAAPELPTGQPAGEYITLTVVDNGRGMSDDVKARIFEPFFTTKEPGKGTGLGLATVFGVVKHAGGFVTVESTLGMGSTFTVYLSRVMSASTIGSPTDQRFVPPGNETVLLADDDPGVQKLGRMALESAGYTVLTANDGQEAVELAERFPGVIDAVVTDLVMPRLGGLGVVSRVRKRWPDVPALVVSGYPEIPADAPAVQVLRKPFTPATLARKLREVLDAKQ